VAELPEVADDDEPAGALEREARRTRVRAAVAALPERQRTALVLCHFQGLSNQDAAAILEVSVDALESLLARARRTLKLALASAET
jgi:RNA polymerase sigma-70 factor (ECF subfamily)